MTGVRATYELHTAMRFASGYCSESTSKVEGSRRNGNRGRHGINNGFAHAALVLETDEVTELLAFPQKYRVGERDTT